MSSVTTEAIGRGCFVNFHDLGNGTFGFRNADASLNQPAHGFVLDAAPKGSWPLVHLDGVNRALSGLTEGVQYLGGAGRSTSVKPPAGTLFQTLGFSVSPTALSFRAGVPTISGDNASTGAANAAAIVSESSRAKLVEQANAAAIAALGQALSSEVTRAEVAETQDAVKSAQALAAAQAGSSASGSEEASILYSLIFG